MNNKANNRTKWTDHNWELIDLPAMNAHLHMALDQIILEQVNAGQRQPTLRFWEWSGPAVAMGIFQSMKNEVDTQAAEKYDIEVSRRISGGGAMFIEPGNTITYSIYAPKSLVDGLSFSDAYKAMDEFVIQALHDLGIKAWYEPLNDITSEHGKIGGAAQAHKQNAVLHHVTMAYDIDVNKMLEVLRIGREKMSDKGTKSAAKRVDPLRSQTGLSRTEIIKRMINTFANNYGLGKGELSEQDMKAANQLVEDKFATFDWQYKVP